MQTMMMWLMILMLLCAHSVDAAEQSAPGIAVEQSGQGPAMVFIPGLNSAAETWQETCEALPVQCHLVQLPGFASLNPIQDEPWLAAMAERLSQYLDDQKIEQPVLVGHSLGGKLAMMMARNEPQRFSRLIIVDSLPFFPAAQNPQATVSSTQPMAEMMRSNMRTMDEPSDAAQARMSIQAMLQGMSRDPANIERLTDWSLASDRWTTSQAMYELMTIDLRDEIAGIETPTLVLGAWAGYAAFGATQESIRQVFEQQYAKLDGVRIELSDEGYHFLMWDDPEWLREHIREFAEL